jgi:hypothetical protein
VTELIQKYKTIIQAQGDDGGDEVVERTRTDIKEAVTRKKQEYELIRSQPIEECCEDITED